MADSEDYKTHELTDQEFQNLAAQFDIVARYISSIEDPSMLAGKGGTVEGFISNLESYIRNTPGEMEFLGLTESQVSHENTNSPLHYIYNYAINISDERLRQELLELAGYGIGSAAVWNLNNIDKYNNADVRDNGAIVISKDMENPEAGMIYIHPADFCYVYNSVNLETLPDGIMKDSLMQAKLLLSDFLPKETIDELPDGQQKVRLKHAMEAFSKLDGDTQNEILRYAVSAINVGQLEHAYGTQAFEEVDNTISPVGVYWAAKQIVNESKGPAKG